VHSLQESDGSAWHFNQTGFTGSTGYNENQSQLRRMWGSPNRETTKLVSLVP
jgi:hypothetical protein